MVFRSAWSPPKRGALDIQRPRSAHQVWWWCLQCCSELHNNSSSLLQHSVLFHTSHNYMPSINLSTTLSGFRCQASALSFSSRPSTCAAQRPSRLLNDDEERRSSAVAKSCALPAFLCRQHVPFCTVDVRWGGRSREYLPPPWLSSGSPCGFGALDINGSCRTPASR